MRVIQGIDLSTIEEQFAPVVPGRTLILDGDGPCYVASAKVKRLDTAVRQFQQHVLGAMFMAGCSEAIVHLTPSGSDKHGRFRVKAAKPYQGNRDNKAKPSLLEPLRHAVADNANWLDEFNVVMNWADEADDGMMRDAYRLGDKGVIRSEDKDLRMTPHPYYEIDRGVVMQGMPVGYVALKHTPAGAQKLAGQGPMFFWGQMLCGDTADNIQGVKLLQGKKCGVAGAYGVLRDVQDIHLAANLVIDAYREIDQNVVAEGWLLWLTRWHKDNVIEYMRSLNLTDKNAAFVDACVLRDWAVPKEQKEERDLND